jgi:hypothetical protein
MWKNAIGELLEDDFAVDGESTDSTILRIFISVLSLDRSRSEYRHQETMVPLLLPLPRMC